MDSTRGRRVDDGVLAGHYRERKLFRPALMAYPQFRIANWVRDDLPDLLWPASLITAAGPDGLRRFCKLQQSVVHALAQSDGSPALVLDGRLSSLEDTPTALRAALVEKLIPEIRSLDVVPAELVGALRLFDDAPGSWLLADPSSDGDEIDPEAALQALIQVVIAIHDGHNEALVKFMETTWLVCTGEFRSDAETIDLLKTYPQIEADWPRADPSIRAEWSARKGATYFNDPDLEQRRLHWSKAFWRQNIAHSACVRRADLAADPSTDPGTDPGGPKEVGGQDQEPYSTAADLAGRDVVANFNNFLDATTGGSAAADPWDPAKHEVVSGLVARAARAIVAVLRSPDLWSDEHGAWIMRVLSETRIVLAWLATQPASRYREYQEYGTGKRKLMRRHMADLVQAMDDPPAFLLRAVEHMEERLGGEWGEELINVSVGATFADMSVRQMADEAGLGDEYRQVYQPASGVTHGEWWAVEDNVMERCVNPLHLFHWIPSLDSPCSIQPAFPGLLASMFSSIVEHALAQLEQGPGGEPQDDPA